MRPSVLVAIPLATGAALLVGLVRNVKPLIWWGWFSTAGFATLSVFRVGGVLVPVALLILILLLDERQRSELRNRE